jgi:hypothetical protein
MPPSNVGCPTMPNLPGDNPWPRHRRSMQGWGRDRWCCSMSRRCTSRPMPVTGSVSPGSPRNAALNHSCPVVQRISPSPTCHARFSTDHCVRIQSLTGFDHYAQRSWHSKHVGKLVAAEIEVGPTTDVCEVVDVFDAKSLLTAVGPVSPLPRRGTDTPTRSETEDETGSAVVRENRGCPNHFLQRRSRLA